MVCPTLLVAQAGFFLSDAPCFKAHAASLYLSCRGVPLISQLVLPEPVMGGSTKPADPIHTMCKPTRLILILNINVEGHDHQELDDKLMVTCLSTFIIADTKDTNTSRMLICPHIMFVYIKEEANVAGIRAAGLA